jgi:hypothetical protein
MERTLHPEADPTGIRMTTTPRPRHWRFHLPLWLVTCLLASIATFLLWTERPGSNTLGVVPYLLLLACPLLHVVAHRTYLRRPPSAGAPTR